MKTMDNKYENIFSPVTINKLTLKNRIIFPPMAFSFDATSGETTDRKMEAYAQMCRGGCGMIIPVTMFPDPWEQRPAWHRAQPYNVAKYSPVRSGARMMWAPLHWSEEKNPSLYDMAEAVHVSGGRICAALGPGIFGWIMNYTANNPDKPLSGFGGFNELTTGEIEMIIEEYANAASWMQASDFDAIEMNMTAIPDYFMLKQFNQRTDRFGGEGPEGRLTFIKEIVQATRAAIGKDFPLIFMFDPDFYVEGLRSIEDSQLIAKKVAEWGVDAIRARGGGWAKTEYEIPNMYIPAGVNIRLAAALKEVVDIPVIAGGKLGDPDLAESVLREGKADALAIGRPLIADPEWPNKIRAGQKDRVRKCIYCNIGCLGRVTLVPRKASRCTVNPLFGVAEKFRHLGPAAVKKKIVVVGGGPAGMSAALTAAQRGHDVTLLEKSAKLGGGGAFNLATVPPFKDDLAFIPEYYEREFKELPQVTVKLNTTADAARVIGEQPDAVIVATGSSALACNLPGADAANVVNYADVLLGAKVGVNVVIVGGGEIGGEVALYLSQKGHRVTILEQLWRLFDNVEHTTRSAMLTKLTESGVIQVVKATVTGISDKSVTYTTDDKAENIAADSVVICLGSQPDNQLYYDLSDKILNLRLVGDANDPRQIMQAVSEGFNAACYL
jgi:2,4-dienoyl-CoA reductase-like NADH-dependent reductase (Old Yellow Enzyme family)/thioredoxin reductase